MSTSCQLRPARVVVFSNAALRARNARSAFLIVYDHDHTLSAGDRPVARASRCGGRIAPRGLLYDPFVMTPAFPS